MRALLLDAGDGQAAAGAARALHRAGWAVGLGAPTTAPLARSRAVSRQHRVPWPAMGPERALTAIDTAVRQHAYDVVLPCGDDWVALLDGVGGERPWSPFRRRAGAAQRCLDKLDVAMAAAAVDLRAPRTIPADERALAAWDGPLVVKARSHWLPEHDDPRHRLEARRVARAEQARPLVEAAAAAGGSAVLQEPVDGQLGAIVGLVVDGRFVQVAQQRADLVWPQPTGITARARTVPLDHRLVERAGALAGHLGYEGMLQVEVLHPTDGSDPVVIDCNPRCYGSLALAEAAGLELTAAWADWAATGAVPRAREARVGVTYLWTEGALRAALAASAPTVAGVLRDVGRSVHPTWDVRDPVPALVLAVQLAGRALRRLAGGRR